VWVNFRVIEAECNASPVIVEVPHASVAVDPPCMPWMIAPVRSIGRDADLYVDRLFEGAPKAGATLVIGTQSRYVCDLNRDVDDIDAESVDGATGAAAPHGLIWHHTTDGHRILACPLPPHELKRRLDEYYYPYHRVIRRLLDARRREFGYAILLCAHSMPSRSRHGGVDVGKRRADIVPGTRGRTTAAQSIIQTVEDVAAQNSWSVTHDDPYKGGFATSHYGQPKHSWHAIQVELSRARYMDESTLVPHAGFVETQAFCSKLVAALTELDPTGLASGLTA
jgi:N-formylglutamate amidohydrolase